MGQFIKTALLMTGFILFMQAPPAQAGILEFFFPTLAKVEPDPSKTLVAPFAAPGAVPLAGGGAQVPAAVLHENDIPLDGPHRNNEQIAEWAVMVVSEALTFAKDEYEESLNNSLQNFDEAGKQQYLAFLEESSINRVLQSRKYYMRGFVQDTPVLLNEGAVGGRYRWLYEVPVMVSYMDRSMRGYKKDADPVNQRISLKVQIGRTKDLLTPGKDVVIESWSGRVLDIAKN